MIWDLIRLMAAVTAGVGLYLVAAAMVRNFANADPPPEEPDPSALADVDYRYRCIVCGAHVVLYVAPEGEEPEAPRHCREYMVLTAPIDDSPPSEP